MVRSLQNSSIIPLHSSMARITTRSPNVVTPDNQTLQYKVVLQCIWWSHVPVNKDSKELNLLGIHANWNLWIYSVAQSECATSDESTSNHNYSSLFSVRKTKLYVDFAVLLLCKQYSPASVQSATWKHPEDNSAIADRKRCDEIKENSSPIWNFRAIHPALVYSSPGSGADLAIHLF